MSVDITAEELKALREAKEERDKLLEQSKKVVKDNEEYEVRLKEMEGNVKEANFKASLTSIKSAYTKANGKAEGFDLFASRNKDAILEGKKMDELAKDKGNAFFFGAKSQIGNNLGADHKVATKDDKINAKFYGRSLEQKIG